MESSEVIFEVTEAIEGGYDARALGHSIFTRGDDWADLKAMVREAVLCHFDADALPKVIRLHLVKDEAIAV
ncbi:MAG: 2-oxoisovalerate dehydrogenase [Gemmatimonadales bacterium]|nr:2-oxoisovalerate dehydrogenase [Candidatus Palauibacter denitrificans]